MRVGELDVPIMWVHARYFLMTFVADLVTFNEIFARERNPLYALPTDV